MTPLENFILKLVPALIIAAIVVIAKRFLYPAKKTIKVNELQGEQTNKRQLAQINLTEQQMIRLNSLVQKSGKEGLTEVYFDELTELERIERYNYLKQKITTIDGLSDDETDEWETLVKGMA